MRSIPEWIGETDDSEIPASVFNRLWRKQDGRCPLCTRQLFTGNITKEHMKPIWAGGENRERNLRLVCTVPCAREKTSGENRAKAKADRALAKHLGFESASERKRKDRYPWRRNRDR